MFPWLTPETVQILLQGLIFTLVLTAVTSVLSFGVGILIGVMRLSRRQTWRKLGAVYVDIFRNVPVLLLIIFLAFAVPNILPQSLRQTFFFNNPVMDWLTAVVRISLPYYFFAAVLALTLNTSAYLAELFRAGVGTIPQEYVDGARTLSASSRDVFWLILLPQGVRAAFPAMSTRLIHNMKNTALAAFVAVPEFFHGTQTAISRSFFALEFLSLAAIVYLGLAFGLAEILRRIEARLNRKKDKGRWSQEVLINPISDL